MFSGVPAAGPRVMGLEVCPIEKASPPSEQPLKERNLRGGKRLPGTCRGTASPQQRRSRDCEEADMCITGSTLLPAFLQSLPPGLLTSPDCAAQAREVSDSSRLQLEASGMNPNGLD